MTFNEDELYRMEAELRAKCESIPLYRDLVAVTRVINMIEIGAPPKDNA